MVSLIKEDSIPDIDNDSLLLSIMAKNAVREAIAEHHKNGCSVFYAEGGYLVEHFPDGRKEKLKKLKEKETFNLKEYLER